MAERLAVDGGPKTVAEPLPGWPQFPEETIQAAMQPLRENAPNYWTNHNAQLKSGKRGSHGMLYEERFAEWEGTAFAVSSATGTAALHIALGGFGIGPGDGFAHLALLNVDQRQSLHDSVVINVAGQLGHGRIALPGPDPHRLFREHPSDQCRRVNFTIRSSVERHLVLPPDQSVKPSVVSRQPSGVSMALRIKADD